MPLAATTVKKAKAKDKPYKLSDEKGMYLLINPKGAKYWRLKYRYGGKEKTLALGVYPDVSLSDARDKRDEARKLVAKEIDPSEVKKERKRARKIAAGNAFEIIAREWWDKQKGNWTEDHAERVIKSLEIDIFPAFGKKPVTEIEPQEVLSTIRKVEARGALMLQSDYYNDAPKSSAIPSKQVEQH